MFDVKMDENIAFVERIKLLGEVPDVPFVELDSDLTIPFENIRARTIKDIFNNRNVKASTLPDNEWMVMGVDLSHPATRVLGWLRPKLTIKIDQPHYDLMDVVRKANEGLISLMGGVVVPDGVWKIVLYKEYKIIRIEFAERPVTSKYDYARNAMTGSVFKIESDQDIIPISVDNDFNLTEVKFNGKLDTIACLTEPKDALGEHEFKLEYYRFMDGVPDKQNMIFLYGYPDSKEGVLYSANDMVKCLRDTLSKLDPSYKLSVKMGLKLDRENKTVSLIELDEKEKSDE